LRHRCGTPQHRDRRCRDVTNGVAPIHRHDVGARAMRTPRWAVTAAGAVTITLLWSAPSMAAPISAHHPVHGSPRALIVGKPIQIAAGHTHNCAILNTTQVECWGWNYNGELGDGSITSSTWPVAVKDLTGVVQIGLGYAHTCALLKDATVKCWGWN